MQRYLHSSQRGGASRGKNEGVTKETVLEGTPGWIGGPGKKGGNKLTTITIYKPNGDDSVRYMDPNSILIENGILSFYWTKEITGQKQKIVTTLPYLIQHDMNGSPSDNMV